GDPALLYQWYANGAPVAGASDSLQVNSSGTYVVTGTESSGCAASSQPFHVTQMPPLPTVNFQINGNTLTTFLTQYNLQWFWNGAPVPGATQDVFDLAANGAYHLQACDHFGCCRSSDTFNLVFTNVGSVVTSDDAFRFNQNNNELIVSLATGTRCVIVDALGREVRSFDTVARPINVKLNDLQAGHYAVFAELPNRRIVTRFVVTR
ncbi:MAG TPA: hypothetical protein VEY71_04510, partial [Chitinophagales bacterium]|nr:hypothetical protein [Chitinophagales bacterium]